MPQDPAGPVPPVRFAPRFDTPMSRSLVELGQHWLLPGLDGVPANTALGLRTNGEFVEAFLVGLNHELGRELLWREYPTPMTATFFDRFWDAAVAPGRPTRHRAPGLVGRPGAGRADGRRGPVRPAPAQRADPALPRRPGLRRPSGSARRAAPAGVPRLDGARHQLLRVRRTAGRRRRLVDRDRRAAGRPALRLRGGGGARRRQPRARDRGDVGERRPRGCASCPPGSPSR